MKIQVLACCLFAALVVRAGEETETVFLDDLDLSNISSGDQMDWRRARRKGRTFTLTEVPARKCRPMQPSSCASVHPNTGRPHLRRTLRAEIAREEGKRM